MAGAAGAGAALTVSLPGPSPSVVCARGTRGPAGPCGLPTAHLPPGRTRARCQGLAVRGSEEAGGNREGT